MSTVRLTEAAAVVAGATIRITEAVAVSPASAPQVRLVEAIAFSDDTSTDSTVRILEASAVARSNLAVVLNGPAVAEPFETITVTAVSPTAVLWIFDVTAGPGADLDSFTGSGATRQIKMPAVAGPSAPTVTIQVTVYDANGASGVATTSLTLYPVQRYRLSSGSWLPQERYALR